MRDNLKLASFTEEYFIEGGNQRFFIAIFNNLQFSGDISESIIMLDF